MILYDAIVKELKKHVFIYHKYHYKSTHTNHYLERFLGKHTAVTPEIIVINDQAQGFKPISQKRESLEEAPIQCELEYSLERGSHDNEKILQTIELVSEIKARLSHKLSLLEEIAKTYKKYVHIERSKVLDDRDDNRSTLIISSTINQLLYDDCLEDDIYNEKISESNVKRLVHRYFNTFSNCLIDLDKVINTTH